MELWLIDDTLRLKAFFERSDSDLHDNICLSIYESCPDEEKLFKSDETNLYMTPEQAYKLADMLRQAADLSREIGTE